MAWFSRNKHLPAETQATLDRLGSMRWPEFEALMGAAFERNGFRVEKTGKGGLEGDVDLILRKDSRTELVQCKQWKTRQIGIAAVREMWSVVSHRGADALKMVSSGTFTDEARKFAQGKAIELIDGEHLVDFVRGVKVPSPGETPVSEPTPPAEAASPACPRCGAAMYKRFNPQTSKLYWGCVQYPMCKGSQLV
jgi:restriction system protein